jgi:hypothetical protein
MHPQIMVSGEHRGILKNMCFHHGRPSLLNGSTQLCCDGDLVENGVHANHGECGESDCGECTVEGDSEKK